MYAARGVHNRTSGFAKQNGGLAAQADKRTGLNS